MSDKPPPPPRYTMWQAIAAAIRLATRAIEEARAAAQKPARVPRVAEWQAGVHYEGAAVTHAGSSWQAVRDTGTEPPGEDWLCLAERGTDARTPALRGAWKVEGAYQRLDVVISGGSSFIALCDAPGACPGDDWQMIARSGRAGPPGPPGPPGERGWPGPPGVSATAFDVDADGLLTLRLSDGSALTCDLYPVLARIAR